MDLRQLDTTPIGEAGAAELRALAARKGAPLRRLLWEAGHSTYADVETCKAWKAAQVRAWLGAMPDKEGHKPCES